MALSWELSDVENYKELCFVEKEGKRKMSYMTETLLYMTMFIGMGEISKKNWQEFYLRTHMHEQAFGAFFRGDNGASLYITPKDIKDHIGLKTNASSMTKAAFNNKLIRYLRETSEKRLYRCKDLVDVQ
jgi:hypothetical protein